MTKTTKAIVDSLVRTLNKTSQKYEILNYLSKGNRLSQSDADNIWGVKSLSSRVSQLQKLLNPHGLYIKSSTVRVNDNCHFSSYTLASHKDG